MGRRQIDFQLTARSPKLTLYPRPIIAALLFVANLGSAQQPKQGGLFEQDVSASGHYRAEQAKELDAYIRLMATDKSRLNKLFAPNYSSPHAFEVSAAGLRRKFAESIGYPPPGSPGKEA